jgi:hypothetical protein
MTAVAEPPANGRRPAANGSGPATTPAADRTPVIRLAGPSLPGLVRAVMIVVACGIALELVWRIRGVVRLVGLSPFLGFALMPVVDALDNRLRTPRSVLILAVSAFLIACVGVIGYLVVPSLVKEVQQLSHDARATPPISGTTPPSATTTTATTSPRHW